MSVTPPADDNDLAAAMVAVESLMRRLLQLEETMLKLMDLYQDHLHDSHGAPRDKPKPQLRLVGETHENCDQGKV